MAHVYKVHLQSVAIPYESLCGRPIRGVRIYSAIQIAEDGEEATCKRCLGIREALDQWANKPNGQ